MRRRPSGAAGTGRCRHHLNAGDDLAPFGDTTFDLTCSLLVLQHVENVRVATSPSCYACSPRRCARGRPAAPSVADLQGPLSAMLPNGVLGAWCRLRYRYGGVMELHGLRREDAVALRRAADGWVVMSDDVLGATAMATAVWQSSSRSADAREAPQGVTGR